jgi:hypothetical protein
MGFIGQQELQAAIDLMHRIMDQCMLQNPSVLYLND